MSVMAIWRATLALPRRRPLPFLVVSLLLAGTDVMFWRMSAYNEATPRAGAAAAILAAKLIVLLLWGLFALRLVESTERSLGSALRLDRRQLGWLAATLLALPALFALRVVLTRLAGLALAARPALLAGLILYLAVALTLLVRLLPAWVGVLLGDRAASLAWSWRATRGRVAGSVLLVMLAIAPAAALHVGLNLFWFADAPALRAAGLLADGAVMALLLATAMSSYRALYLRAKA